MIDILMPALSPTMEEGTLAKWNIKVGDAVEAGQVIAEIETDKATMEVEAVDEGVVEAILVEAGAEGVKVNTAIARLKVEGGADGAAPAPVATAPDQPTPGASAADPRAERDEVAKSTADANGGVMQETTAGDSGGAVRTANPTYIGGSPQAAPPTSLRGGSGAETTAPRPEPTAPQPSTPTPRPGDRVFASPLARRLAKQKGVELSEVTGSGPHGRIIAADLDKAPAAAKAPASKIAPEAPTAAGSGPQPVKSLAQLGIADGSYDLVPLDGMRKVIARRMTESFRDIPHFPLTIDLEIDRLLDARGRINTALHASGVKVSVNDLVIRAAAAALKKVPEANASYTPAGIALHHHADIAMAVAVEGGLITPIIRAAEEKSLAQIAAATKDLAERARSKKLKPEEFQGGTFSVSNLGMFGIKSFASIINEPQGAILSVGAGEKRPVARGDQLAVATVMTVTLTCDHRVVDGSIGARWLQAFKGFVEDPITLLA